MGSKDPESRCEVRSHVWNCPRFKKRMSLFPYFFIFVSDETCTDSEANISWLMSDANKNKITGPSLVGARKLCRVENFPSFPSHTSPKRGREEDPSSTVTSKSYLSPGEGRLLFFDQRGDGVVRMEARGWSNTRKRPWAKECRRPLGARKSRKHSPPEPLEATTLATPWPWPSETDFRFWISQSVREKMWAVVCHHICGYLLQQQ